MKQFGILTVIMSIAILCSCNSNDSNKKVINSEVAKSETSVDTLTAHLKPFKTELPTIGLLIYSGVLQTEITAPSDVFAKPSQDGEQLFNVITIAQTENPITTEEGLRILPDYTFDNAPKLAALVVPSGYDMYSQVRNDKLVNFIIEKNKETKYIVSNCGGAQLIGKSGIADGRKIVTWIGGGVQLQKDYPNLLVQDDTKIAYVEDGKFLSSNGNLVSYISALKLVEKMSSPEHRKYVESYLFLDRFKNWKE
ncbi:DJ-1/PfpI family protein [Tenacibaculum ovolyticum]|uniref:DJ-1/PfpI family protein n=1 Tax=Tenacibaculum ovolyticum TaxID=104270 RepID=UPI001F3AD340|nr:DJ-1/PfpI family protein [Tenacibaculum ovolyticum]